jgi:hypothetical protein
MGQTENAYEALVGKPEWKKIPVWRPRYGLKDNIKVHIKIRVGGCGLVPFGSG